MPSTLSPSPRALCAARLAPRVKRGAARSASLALACLFALGAARESPARAPAWQRVAIHPEAARAEAKYGARWLWSLLPWRGRLFVGYGSYNGANPRAVVRAFDPAALRFSPAPAFAADNEALGIIRALGTRLYAPAWDAQSGGAVAQNFAASADERGEVWRDHAARVMFHVFDVATLDGGADVWFVGTDPARACPYDTCTEAVAFRSADGGQTFAEAIRLAGPPYGYRYAWFSFAGVFRGKLYLQAYFRGSAAGGADIAHDHSYVFDGRAWSIGPDLLPARRVGDMGYQPVAFDDRLVYMTRAPIARSYPNTLPLWQNRMDLVTLDSQERVTYLSIPAGVAQFSVGGEYLYVLTRGGEVRRTRSLSAPWRSWEQLAAFHVNDPDPAFGNAGRSVAALDGFAYVGTSQGELWRLPLPRKRAGGAGR
ncbi:MAG: hypothetical protein LC800_15400 [Acidobacteria bacterium]|nr:hypothetical protein [Acidobacteriota bacterium]